MIIHYFFGMLRLPMLQCAVRNQSRVKSVMRLKRQCPGPEDRIRVVVLNNNSSFSPRIIIILLLFYYCYQ
jgi:hypothetical protein